MSRVYTKFDRVIVYVTEYYGRYHKYPSAHEISNVFRVGKRCAFKMLRRFFLELGE